jgi:hypothetical protein
LLLWHPRRLLLIVVFSYSIGIGVGIDEMVCC